MRRWKNSTKMMIGMVMTTAAAVIVPVGTANAEFPVKKAIAAGAVRALVVEVSVIASRNSFQQNRNTRIAVVTMPGAASGAMTVAISPIPIELISGRMNWELVRMPE